MAMAAGIKERVSDTKVKLIGFVGDVSGKKRARFMTTKSPPAARWWR
jgi:hypothetical protein